MHLEIHNPSRQDCSTAGRTWSSLELLKDVQLASAQLGDLFHRIDVHRGHLFSAASLISVGCIPTLDFAMWWWQAAGLISDVPNPTCRVTQKLAGCHQNCHCIHCATHARGSGPRGSMAAAPAFHTSETTEFLERSVDFPWPKHWLMLTIYH